MEIEDLISRQAVIDSLYALCDTGGTLKENPWRDNPHIDAVVETIEQLPSAENTAKWIPVNNKLPELLKDVLMCNYDADIRVGYYQNGYYADGRESEWYLYDKDDYFEPIAWMPLPEPYKESEG